MIGRLLSVLLAVLPAGGFAVEPPVRDLGEGLGYLRVPELPGGLPLAPAGRPPPLVVDLRGCVVREPGTEEFTAWLQGRVAQRGVVFVLANGATAESLRRALTSRPRGAGVVVIGPPADGFVPDLAAVTTAEGERAALAALAAGAPLAALVSDQPGKVRHDEARLGRVASAPAAAEPAATLRPEPPPIDAALQRAVHLHRALLALRKI